MPESKLRTQSMEFAVSIINLVKFLREKRESIISNQIGRSDTSIGANIREAQYAHDKADFIAKLCADFSALKRSKNPVLLDARGTFCPLSLLPLLCHGRVVHSSLTVSGALQNDLQRSRYYPCSSS